MQSAERKPNPGLRQRTTDFALRIIRLYVSVEKRDVSLVIGRQLLRSGTSVGAHYPEAGRARSVAEFVSKMEGGLQELDETAYWLELLTASRLVPLARLGLLLQETEELIAMFVASIKTAKQKRRP